MRASHNKSLISVWLMSRGSLVMWSADNYQSFADLTMTKFQLPLNDPQFVCGNLPATG